VKIVRNKIVILIKELADDESVSCLQLPSLIFLKASSSLARSQIRNGQAWLSGSTDALIIANRFGPTKPRGVRA
jgi:hypothetical protein